MSTVVNAGGYELCADDADRNRPAISATRAPYCRAVSRSPGDISSGVASAGVCAIGPKKDPMRLMSPRWDALVLEDFTPTPTQMPRCCAASSVKYCSVASLSPLTLALLVNPPKILSFHWSANHGLEESSANFLNCQLGPHI